MAIIIKGTKANQIKELWSQTYNIENQDKPLRRVIDLSIDGAGAVTLNGKKPDVLDLGNVGDDWATVLRFNVNVNDSPSASLLQNYHGFLYGRYSYDGKNWINLSQPLISSYSNVFYIPYDGVTDGDCQYEFVYVLKENKIGNIDDEEEIFVSEVFKGLVKPSLYYHLLNNSEIIDPIPSTTTSLLKRSVVIKINDTTKNVVIDASGKDNLGYECDRYVNRIVVDGFESGVERGVYFYKPENIETNEKEVSILAIADEDSKGVYRVWIPPQVTNNAGEYQMMVVAYDDNGAEFYSDTFKMKVIENFLSDSMFPQGRILDSENNIIYVLKD